MARHSNNRQTQMMDQQAFLDFIDRHKDMIFRLSLRYLVSKESAEDATQEVILKLWKGRKKLDQLDTPAAYAMTMAKNYCLDQLKLKGNNNLRMVHTNFSDQKTSLQKQLEVKDELSMVSKIIQTLSEQEQMLIQLRDVEQLEYSEMAGIMKMKETAMRVALSRARKKIRTQMIKINRYGTAGN